MERLDITEILNEVNNAVKKTYTALYNEHSECCGQFYMKYRIYCRQNSITASENIDDIASTLALIEMTGLKEKLRTSEENLKNNRFKDINYVFYSKEQNKVLFITVENNIVTKFYKTDDKKEIIYLLAIDIINNIVWNIIRDNYSDSYYVYYDEDTWKTEECLYNSMFNNLDNYIREYYKSNKVKDKFIKLLDSDEYRAWLNKL